MVVVTTRGLFSVAAVKISSALVSSREREGISQVEQTSLQTRGATSSDIPPDKSRGFPRRSIKKVCLHVLLRAVMHRNGRVLPQPVLTHRTTCFPIVNQNIASS